MTDDDDVPVKTGDWISFSYGIPPIRVDARLSTQKGVLTLTVLGNHKPRTMALSRLRDHVGSWYKTDGPITRLVDKLGAPQ
jgi:hypothetical protein